MKYCRNCGTPLKDETRFCTSCGTNQDPNSQNQVNYNPYIYQPNSPSQTTYNPYQGNTLGMISIGLGLMVPIGGIVCGIMAINKGKKLAQKNKVAIILGVLGIVLAIIAWAMNIYTTLSQPN